MTTDNEKYLEPAVARFLDAIDVAYEVVRIEPEYADTGAFCEKYGYPAERAANTIIIASKRAPVRYCACVVMATTRLDVNRRVRRLMEASRVSFATAEQMADLTGMKVGGVTPFALPAGLPVYVDSRVMEPDWIILGSGGRDAKVKISPAVFHRIESASIIDDLARQIQE